MNEVEEANWYSSGVDIPNANSTNAMNDGRLIGIKDKNQSTWCSCIECNIVYIDTITFSYMAHV